MANLNHEQTKQVRRILRALLSASDKVREMLADPSNAGESVTEEELRGTADALIRARLRLEQSERNIFDLPLKHLLIHLDRAEAAAVLLVVDLITLRNPTLSNFGKRPWFEIQEIFLSYKVTCPLVLKIFHAEYQSSPWLPNL